MSKEISNDAEADTVFAARILAALPAEVPSAALEARILADFDAISAKRARSPWVRAARTARRLGDAIWPGVPAWQPVSVLTLSLLIGLAAGTFVPAWTISSDASSQTLTLDAPPALDTSGDS